MGTLNLEKTFCFVLSWSSVISVCCQQVNWVRGLLLKFFMWMMCLISATSLSRSAQCSTIYEHVVALLADWMSWILSLGRMF